MAELPKIHKKGEEPFDPKAVSERLVKEADRICRKIGASTCVVVATFVDGRTVQFVDGGQFPIPPVDFYTAMVQAHAPKIMRVPQSKIIMPHQ